MRVTFDTGISGGEKSISLDEVNINISDNEKLELALEDSGSPLRLAGSDAVKITIKAKSNLAEDAVLFDATFGVGAFVQPAEIYRLFVNYRTPAMMTLLAAGNPAGLALDAQYLPQSGEKVTSDPAALSGTQAVSSSDDMTAAGVPDAYSRFLALDEVQSFDGAHQAQGQANLGLGSAATKAAPATGNASSSQVVMGSDTRLSDARTPSAHASTHASGGSDPITIAESQVTNLVSDLAAKAPLNSPALTGTPTVPTATLGTNTTQAASTAFVEAAITALVNGAPGALVTLKELADAMGDDPNFATTITNAIAAKVASTRAVNTSGLASGGGNLSADRTINVPIATQAQAEAGTDNATAMTPLRVAEAIAALAGSGGSGGITMARGIGSVQGWTTGPQPAAGPALVWNSGILFSGGTPQWFDGNTIHIQVYDNTGTLIFDQTFEEDGNNDGVNEGNIAFDSGEPSDFAAQLNNLWGAMQSVGCPATLNWNDDGSGNLQATWQYTGTTGAATQIVVAGPMGTLTANGNDAIASSGYSTAVELILAPGAGKTLKFVSLMALIDGNPTGSWNGTFSLQYADSTVIAQMQISSLGSVGALSWVPQTIGNGAFTSGSANQGIVIAFTPNSSVDTDMCGGHVSFYLVASVE